MDSLKVPSLTDRTVEALTDYILREGLQPGALLPTEQELCDKLGIGRSTLREAVKVLESRGLVDRQQGVGARVIDGSQLAATQMLQLLFRRRQASAEDLLEVRKLYEIRAAALAAERATSHDLRSIREALDAMRATQASIEEYVEGDLGFHLAIARATHNGVLTLIVETVRPLLRDEIAATLKVDPRPEPRHHYHEKIYTAIEEGDAARAAEAMEQHLRATEEMLRQHAAVEAGPPGPNHRHVGPAG